MDENLKDMPWTYTLGAEEKVVQFSNVEAESVDEEEFLEGLKEEGSKQTIEGKGKLTYNIARLDGKLQLSLFLDEDKRVEDRKEIEEQEALRIFRESKESRGSGGLSDLFNLFRGKKLPKELVTNNITVEFDRIENIALREDNRYNSLEISGEGLRIELKEDGGCSIQFL